MMRLTRIFVLVSLTLLTSAATAQNWKQVLTLPNNLGSSAFFLNANVGFIGTGVYQLGLPAEIYRTLDGGRTWQRAGFPANNLAGQVTDIFFRNFNDGWATLRQSVESGWTGVYHSIDGGLTWKLMIQAKFPVAVRETGKGIYFTDRDLSPGIKFSSDGGLTWRQQAFTISALGFDFIDDNNGFVSSQSYGPHLITTDGGTTWNTITTPSEAWTVYGDAANHRFLLASERDNNGINSIIKINVGSQSEVQTASYAPTALTGGIAGSHGCTSVLYVQHRKAAGNILEGLARSFDGGQTWVQIGGPSNKIDTRLAVTGHGAVVVAFDSVGGVWMTRGGGDGTLSPSILPALALGAENAVTTGQVCDSTPVKIDLHYNGCDSLRISKVTFENDAFGELHYTPTLQYFSTANSATLTFVFRPTRILNWTARVRLTVEQPDGYLEDTMISIGLSGLAPNRPLLSYGGTNAPRSIEFDSVSVCTNGDHEVTLINLSCNDISVFSLNATAPFALSSQFHPFTLSSGDARTFLLTYTPTGAIGEQGVLHVVTNSGADSLSLHGTGYHPTNVLPFNIPAVTAPLCDSSLFTISFRNIQCKSARVTDITTFRYFHVAGTPPQDSIKVGATGTISFYFIPDGSAPVTDSIRLQITLADGTTIDTLLHVSAVGTSGKASITLSATSLQLPDVTLCGSALDTVVISNSGCGDLHIATSLDNSSGGFSIVRSPTQPVVQGSNDTVIIRFDPVGVGTGQSTLTIHSEAGDKSIPVAINVSADPGKVTASVTPTITSLTCLQSKFQITVSNSTCDSIYVQHLDMTGANPADFIVLLDSTRGLAKGGSVSIDGVFAPQDSLSRTATLTLHLVRRDGTSYDETVPLSAFGIPAPPIRVAIGAGGVRAKQSSMIDIPIYALSSSATDPSMFEFALKLRTDLLTPQQLQTNQGIFGGATINAFNVYPDSVSVQLTAPGGLPIKPGLLWMLRCKAFVTDTLLTNVTLLRSGFADATNGVQCLETTSLPDSVTTFELDPECGNSNLSHYMAHHTIAIDEIRPNPTTGNIQVTFTLDASYLGDAILEIYDELGAKLESRAVKALNGAHELAVNLSLAGPAGVRYLRLSGQGITDTRRIVIQR